MKVIKKFLVLLRHLRNGEHFDFFWSIIHFLKAVMNFPPALIPLRNVLFTFFDREDDIYKRSLKSFETKFIEEADIKRDNSFVMLRKGIEFALYSEDPDTKRAAETLMEVMDNYKDASRATLGENTSLIINMIQDLEKPRYAGAVSLLGLTETVRKLDENNIAFKELYTERTLNINEQKSQGTMDKARQATDKAFFEFTDAVSVLYKSNELVGKDPVLRKTLSDLIDFINSYVSQYERILARRSAKYKPGKSGSDVEDDTPEMTIPHLIVDSQEILGQSSLPGMSDYGTMMSIQTTDAEAFRTALYPIARGCELALSSGEGEDRFPVTDFLKDADEQVIGLIVEAPDPNTCFIKPFSGQSEQDGQILKDDELIAVLEKIRYPNSTIIG
jgi:hypothetical protein